MEGLLPFCSILKKYKYFNPARNIPAFLLKINWPISASPTRLMSSGAFFYFIPLRETFPNAAAAQTRAFRGKKNGSLKKKFKERNYNRTLDYFTICA